MLAGAGLFSSLAQTNTSSFTFNLTNAIPDGNASGLANHQTISGLQGAITDINVTLSLSGGFNGDLYLYLVHGSTAVVLLNRVGRSTSDVFGYGDSGLSLTLDDQAGSNIHWYNTATPSFNSAGQLLGVWQPDGRTADPDQVDETSLPTTHFGLFQNQDPNGTWTLFAADLSDGGVSVLNSWGLEVTTVPEPTAFSLLTLVGGMFLINRKR